MNNLTLILTYFKRYVYIFCNIYKKYTYLQNILQNLCVPLLFYQQLALT